MVKLPQTSGIYTIRNIQNGKLWVGQSTNIRQRRRSHWNELRAGIDSPHLQAAWNKFGDDYFEFSTVELCPIERLNVRENYWIEFYGSYDRNHGYNLERFASGTGKRSLEFCRKLSSAKRGKPCSIRGYKWVHNPSSGERTMIPKGANPDPPWVFGFGPQTLEAVANRARANRGKKRTKITKRRMSLAHKGKSKPSQQRQKMSEAAKRRTDLGRDGSGKFFKLPSQT